MKKALSRIILASLSSVFLPLSAAANGDITVTLDGSVLSFDQPPVIINDRTMVPMRAVFEALGYEVQWNDSTNVATAVKGENSIVVGKYGYISCSGGLYSSDADTVITNGRLLVPLRSISECVGCTVDWNGATQTVKLQSGEVKQKEIETAVNKITFNSGSTMEEEQYEYFRKNVFPQQYVVYYQDYSDNGKQIKESSHEYIDIDNDGSDELIIYCTDPDSEAFAYMSIWKMTGLNMISSLFTRHYEIQSRPVNTYSVINYSGKNYLNERSYFVHHGEMLFTDESFEFTEGKWLSVNNSTMTYFAQGFYDLLMSRGQGNECGDYRTFYLSNGNEMNVSKLMDREQIYPGTVVYEPVGKDLLSFAQKYVSNDKQRQVESGVKYGDYLSAIQTADELLSYYKLSGEERSNISALRQKAQERYDAYVNGTLSFYDATAEIEEISRKLGYNPQSALEDCKNTLAWHELSPEDTKTIERFRVKAEYRASKKNLWNREGFDDPAEALKRIMTYIKNGAYDEAMELCMAKNDSVTIFHSDEYLYRVLYNRALNAQQSIGMNKITSNQALNYLKNIENNSAEYIAKFGPVYDITDLGDCYYIHEYTTRNANGSEFFFVFNNGAVSDAGCGSDPEFTFSRNCVILNRGYFSDVSRVDISRYVIYAD